MENPFVVMGWFFILFIVGLIVLWFAIVQPEPDLDGDVEEIEIPKLEHKQ